MIYAVDFDGTLCVDKFPEIGEPRMEIINALIGIRNRCGPKNARFILWTCREGAHLEQAVRWCASHGLVFDAINDNLPEHIKRWGNNPRKVYADAYIDDRNVHDVLGVAICELLQGGP